MSKTYDKYLTPKSPSHNGIVLVKSRNLDKVDTSDTVATPAYRPLFNQDNMDNTSNMQELINRITKLENMYMNLPSVMSIKDMSNRVEALGNANECHGCSHLRNEIAAIRQETKEKYERSLALRAPDYRNNGSSSDTRNVIIHKDKEELVIEYEEDDKIILPEQDLKMLNLIHKEDGSYDLSCLSTDGFLAMILILKQFGYVYDGGKKQISKLHSHISNPPVLHVLKYVSMKNGQIIKEEVDFDYKGSPPSLVDIFYMSATSYKEKKRIYLEPYVGKGNIVEGLLAKKVSKTDIFALDIHTNVYDTMKNILPTGNVDKIDFLMYSKSSYDKNKINTILLFSPFSKNKVYKAILHAYNILMNAGDVLVAVIPETMVKHLDTLTPPNANASKELSEVFDIFKKALWNKTLTRITSTDPLFPMFIENQHAGVVHLQKL